MKTEPPAKNYIEYCENECYKKCHTKFSKIYITHVTVVWTNILCAEDKQTW